MNLAPFNISASTNLTKNINLRVTVIRIDPYALNDNNIRVNQFQWDKTGDLGRLTAATVALNLNLRSKQGEKKKKSKYASEEEIAAINANKDAYVDFTEPWSISIGYNLSYSKPARTETINNALNIGGDFSVTKKWKVGFKSGYDFIQQEFTYTTIDIYRDLHCWDMQFQVIPFGTRKRYEVTIKVKAPTLQDLKLTRKRDWYDLN